MVTYKTKNCCKSYDGCNLSETRDLPQRGGEQFCACAVWDTNGVCIVYQFPRYQGLVGTTRELRDLNIREGLEFKS